MFGYLTGSKYTDFKIYNLLSDYDLFNLMLTSKKNLKYIDNEDYYKYRILSLYGKDVINNNCINPCSFKKQNIDIVNFFYKCSDNTLYSRFDLILIAKNFGWKPSYVQFNKIVAHSSIEVIKRVINLFDIKISFDLKSQYRYIGFEYLNTLDSAIYGGNIDTIKWLVKNFSLLHSNYGIKYACIKGNINALKWIYKKWNIWHDLKYSIPIASLSVIKWLISINKFEPSIYDLPFNNLEIDTFLFENHYYDQLNQKILDLLIGQDAKYFHILQKTDIKPSIYAVICSIRYNNIESLKFLANNYKFSIFPRYNLSFRIENLDALKFAHEIFGIIPTQNDCNYSYTSRFFNNLRWMYETFNLLPSPDFIIDRLNDNIDRVDILYWLYNRIDLKINQNIVNNISSKASVDLLNFFYTKYNILPTIDTKMLENANFAALNWCKKFNLFL